MIDKIITEKLDIIRKNQQQLRADNFTHFGDEQRRKQRVNVGQYQYGVCMVW